MSLSLSEILPLPYPDQYKVHLASWNGLEQPLDVFVSDYEGWIGWNRWRSGKNEFNRRYILSLIDFYPEANVWLFGGIFEVTGRKPVNFSPSYTVAPLPLGDGLAGRLKIRFKRPSRGRSIRLEPYMEKMQVMEVLRNRYAGDAFPGHDNIHVSFTALSNIVRQIKPDWHASLRHAKGVYAISDRHTGRHYVGSAYGNEGVWSRWSAYLRNGHGGNAQLKTLINQEGMEYARQHFTFSLLEHHAFRTDDQTVIDRENFWKRVMLSRTFGYNRN